MKRIAKKQKEKLAYEILELLKRYDLTGDVRIYFNNRCLTGDGAVLEDIKGSDYFKYATDKTISMSFEGDLCEVLNYYHRELSEKVTSEFRALLDAYGLYYELGEHWNLGTYFKAGGPLKSPKPVIKGAHPDNPIYITNNDCPAELEPIRAEWEKRQNEYGDIGSCVLGAAFTFSFNKQFYRMRPQGHYQGNCSWEDSVGTIRYMLSNAGCEDVVFHYGNMN